MQRLCQPAWPSEFGVTQNVREEEWAIRNMAAVAITAMLVILAKLDRETCKALSHPYAAIRWLNPSWLNL
jgi:hypothetical protein